jgi:hypothetical protein
MRPAPSSILTDGQWKQYRGLWPSGSLRPQLVGQGSLEFTIFAK